MYKVIRKVKKICQFIVASQEGFINFNNQHNKSMTDFENNEELFLDNVAPFELEFQQISVMAKIKIEKEEDGKKIEVEGEKNILKQCSGKFSPNTFTAILGPSGCGKTTMLNLISGRLLSDNLELRGLLKINGQATTDIGKYKTLVGYVMQDDFMLPTFTPFECFKFVADLRMPNLSQQTKLTLVNHIISSLGLEKCRDTYVGDTRIRGISGGQKKRTSIGLQLLINPSIIFLDEPTTGLDSTTSLNLVRFLNKLARKGRTIISTIHQPSSQIFDEFNRILLMVDGNIIYDGDAKKSISYFKSINLQVPSHTNPTDYYMKLMNKEGIMLNYVEKKVDYTESQINRQFEERVQFLTAKYQAHQSGVEISKYQRAVVDESHETSWCTQFSIIFKRNWQNQFRQPMDVILKIVQSVFFGVFCIILFQRKGTTYTEIIQNNQGVLFFFIMNIGFSMIFATVNLFNFERPVFIRQRLSNTYSTSAYFMGRSMAVFPIQLLIPFLFAVIGYFPVNLNNSAQNFFWTLLSMELCSWMSTSFGLLLSTLFADAGIVMALVPVLIIPFLLVAGFFVPLSQVFGFYYPFEYLSMFRYGFEAIVYSQYFNGLQFNGTMTYPLTSSLYQFQTPFWVTLLLMGIIGALIRALALFVMYKISNPRIMPLLPPLKEKKNHHGQPEILLGPKQ